MDFSLTEEQQMLKKMIRDFCKKESPREKEREWDAKKEYPQELWDKMAALGLPGILIPTEYDGMGGNFVDAAIAMEELNKGSDTAANIFEVPVNFGSILIDNCASEEQKRRLLPGIAKGEIRLAFGLTEPNAGSDAASLQTRAVADGDDFIINGQKIFITGANIADYIMLVTRTDPNAEAKHRGLTIFFLDPKSPGVTLKPIDKLGGRASPAFEVFLEDVRVSKKDILGGEERLHRGWKQVMSALDGERIMMAAGAVGLASAVFEDAFKYAMERKQFGQPIGKFQAIEHMLADMDASIEGARWLTYHAAWMKSQGLECSRECSIAKLTATEMAKKACVDGMQILGGYGFTMEFDMQRFMRRSFVLTIGGGSSQIQRTIISKINSKNFE